MGITVRTDRKFESIPYSAEKVERVAEIFDEVAEMLVESPIQGHEVLCGEIEISPLYVTYEKKIEIEIVLFCEGIFESKPHAIDKEKIDDNVTDVVIEMQSDLKIKYDLIIKQTFGLNEILNYDDKNSESLTVRILAQIHKTQTEFKIH